MIQNNNLFLFLRHVSVLCEGGPEAKKQTDGLHTDYLLSQFK